MPHVKIDKNKCKGCMLCISVCPKGLIVRSKTLNRRGIHYVESKKQGEDCTGCCMCAVMCPDMCIEVWK